MRRSHLWLLWLISVVLKMLGDCIKLRTPGEIFQPVDAFSNQIQGKCALAASILNFQDHFARHVFNNDEAFPSEILAIWAEGLLAHRYHYRMVMDTPSDCGTVPYSCFCCSLKLLTFGEQNRLVSLPSDGKCLLRRKIFCQARQMFEEIFFSPYGIFFLQNIGGHLRIFVMCFVP